MFGEGFRRGAPSEGFPWSGVEGVGDGRDVVCGPPGKVSALRKVLAQKAIGVLIGAALPRALRIGEVHLYPGSNRELGMRREFLAPIQVNDWRNSWGSVVIVCSNALAIVIAP